MVIVGPNDKGSESTGPLEPDQKGALQGRKAHRLKNDKTPTPLIKTTDSVPERIKRPVSHRRSSSAGKVKEEHNLLALHTGELWQCEAKSKGAHGGYLYHFRIKPEVIGKIDKRLEEIFPAIEAVPNHINPMLNIQRILDVPLLKELGYSFENGVLILPDKEALTNNWRELQQKYPHLPDLDIAPSEGIADDTTFAKSYLMYDVLLSAGKEFVHDHLFHVIPTIKLLSSTTSFSYKEVRVGIVMAILRSLRRLEFAKSELSKLWPQDSDEVISNGVRITKLDIEQLEKSLGALVDETAAIDTLVDSATGTLQTQEKQFLNLPMILNLRGWEVYRKRIYKDQPYDPHHLEEVWKELGRLEDAYLDDALRDKPFIRMSHPFYKCVKETATEHGKLYTFQVPPRYIGNDDKTVLHIQQVYDSAPAEERDLHHPPHPAAVELFINPAKRADEYINQFLACDRVQNLTSGYTTAAEVDEMLQGILQNNAALIQIRKRHPEALQHATYMRMLGYEYKKVDGGDFFVAPDQELLMHNWQKLQKLLPTLPPLTTEITSKSFLLDHFNGPITILLKHLV